MRQMSVAAARSKEDLAAQVWRAMAGFTFARFQRGEHFAILRELGLTPGHLKALAVLDPEQPRPMRAMADALACDASLVTWLTDRLEERGLVERRSDPSDRRVKTIALTAQGVKTRQRLAAAFFEPPPDLLDLDTKTLDALHRGLAKLPAPITPFWIETTSPGDEPN
jgi:DNA-binding MarR family transcriptional regulator